MMFWKANEGKPSEPSKVALANEDIERGLENRLAFWDGLRLFPGPITDYERLVGYEVEPVDTGLRSKMVFPSEAYRWRHIYGDDQINWALTLANMTRRFMAEGVEALVNIGYQTSNSVSAGYGGSVSDLFGLPVRKKR